MAQVGRGSLTPPAARSTDRPQREGDQPQHETSPLKVIVHWPGQRAETFSGLQANTRYRLVEGSGRAVPVPPRSASLKLAASDLQEPEVTEQARAILRDRVPLPDLGYEDFQGQPATLQLGQPTLVQLWASWCPMCQAELNEFTQRTAEIEATGMRVLALSVDGLGADTSNVQNAIEAIGRLKYPFPSGHATERLLGILETLRGELYSNLQPFPIPTSFLIDAQGHLFAIYLGPMQVDDLIADIRQLDVDDEQLRVLASPLPGRWFTEPKIQRLMPIAQALEENGYAEEAAWYRGQAKPETALGHCSVALDLERQGDARTALAHYQQAVATDPNSSRVHELFGKFLMRQRQFDAADKALQRAIELDPHMAEAYFNRATLQMLQQNAPAAIDSYRRAIAAEPDYAEAHAALGRLLQQLGQTDEAATHFKSAIQADPYLAPPYVYLGWLLAQRRQLDQSVKLLEQAVALQPDLVDAYEKLGDVLVVQRKFDDAVQNYRQAVRLAPQLPAPSFKLAWHLATQADVQKSADDEAVRLAEQLADATQRKAPQMLDLLAAAYADAGRFSEAAVTAQQALDLNPTNPKLAEAIRQRLALYRQQKPYRSPNE